MTSFSYLEDLNVAQNYYSCGWPGGWSGGWVVGWVGGRVAGLNENKANSAQLSLGLAENGNKYFLFNIGRYNSIFQNYRPP